MEGSTWREACRIEQNLKRVCDSKSELPGGVRQEPTERWEQRQHASASKGPKVAESRAESRAEGFRLFTFD